MEHIAIEFPASTFNVESRGVALEVDPSKIPADLFRQVIWHGINQKVADAAANATAQIWQDVKGKDAPKPSRDQLADFAEANAKAIATQTLAMMRKALDALYAGQWQVRAASDGSSTRKSSADPVRKLARDMATTFLATTLTAALGKDISVWAKQDKLKTLFRFTDKGSARFDLAAVDQWMEANKGKRDYMAEAKAELDRAKAFNVDSDAEALVADLGL